jgi:hypothetical protein
VGDWRVVEVQDEVSFGVAAGNWISCGARLNYVPVSFSRRLGSQAR